MQDGSNVLEYGPRVARRAGRDRGGPAGGLRDRHRDLPGRPGRARRLRRHDQRAADPGHRAGGRRAAARAAHRA